LIFLQYRALNLLGHVFVCAVSLGQTLDVQRGASLFSRTCIGCHDAGGNIIQPVSLLVEAYPL